MTLVRSPADGRRALEAARLTGDVPVLRSPPAAAATLGIGWWQALVSGLRAEFPQVAFQAVLDCGTAPGLALAALHAGIEAVEVAACPRVMESLREISTLTGGCLLLPGEEGPGGGRGGEVTSRQAPPG